MTLLLGVPPMIARDFSFGIQAFGMTVAAMTIFGLQVPVDYDALIWATVGGSLGLVVGLVGIAPYLPPAYAKMLFVSVWLTFAVALFKLNTRGRDRRVYQSALESDQAVNDEAIEHMPQENFSEESGKKTRELSAREKKQRSARAWLLFFTGCFGGICSSVAGSGLDIASFSILTLYFRVSEKVASPTSVVLMAVNAIVGVFCRTAIGLGGAYEPGEMETVWNFVSVCVPIVVIGAPLGATIASKLPRHWLAYLIYFLDTVQFVSALAIVQPWSKPSPHNVGLCVASALTLVVGTAFFFKVASWGENRGECELRVPSPDKGVDSPSIAQDDCSTDDPETVLGETVAVEVLARFRNKKIMTK